MSPVWWVVIGLVAGGLIGGAVAWVLSERVGPGRQAQDLKRENARFREEVTEHFVETASLINNLTDSYKAVFDHLSSGADKLVERKAVLERMPRVSGEEVRLKHIGAPKGHGDTSSSGRRTEPGRPVGRPRQPAKSGAVRSPLHVKRPK